MNVNAVDEELRNSALHYACKKGYASMVKILLAHPNIDVNLSAKQGYTPLFLASQENHVDVVKLLLVHPAIDVNKPGPLGTTALAIASHNGNEVLVELLLEHRGSRTLLHDGDDAGEQLAGKGAAAKPSDEMAEINLQNANGATSFFMACQAGRTAIVQRLLQTGKVDCCRAKSDGASPLYIAAEKGHIEIVRLLLSLPEIQVNQVKNGGFTPLYVASQEGHLEIMQELLADPKIAVNQASQSGATPLCVASFSGKLAAVKMLLADERVSVNQAKEDGATPLWVAAEKGHKNVVLWLLGSGRDIDASLKTISGNSPWNNKNAAEWAKQCDHPEIAQIIEAYVANPKKEREKLSKQLGIEFNAVGKELEVSGITTYQIKPLHFRTFAEVTRLSLNSLGLSKLSENIAKFTGLITLNLADNKLTTLPVGILELPALKTLILKNNLFQDGLFPEGADCMKKLNSVDVDIRGTPLFEKESRAIFAHLSLKNDPSSIRFTPVIFEAPEIVTSLNLSNCQITLLGPKIAELSFLVHLTLDDNPLSVDSFLNLADLIKKCSTLRSLRIKKCGTTSAGATHVIKALLFCRTSGSESLTLLEMDNVKLEDTHALESVPLEVAQEGSQRVAAYLTSLNRHPQLKPNHNTKLIVLGDKGSGKSTLVDTLFPLSGDVEAAEGWYGYFSNTQYHYALEGSRLQKYKSADAFVGLERPLEDIFLERSQWTVTPIEDWMNYGVHLAQTVSPYRQIYLYWDQADDRDSWQNRLQRTVSSAPTVGIGFSHMLISHSLGAEAPSDSPSVTLTVLDCSGDRDLYFQGQQLFIQPRAVYLVAFDLSKGDEGIAGLGFWLQAIAARMPRFPSPPLEVEGKKLPRGESPAGDSGRGGEETATAPRLYSIIVVGTHSDDSSVSPDQHQARAERVGEVVAAAGLGDAAHDFFEVSGTMGTNLDALQSAIYFVPLTHSYMAEKLPDIYVAVEEAVMELKKTHAPFPLVPLERVIEQCNKNSTVDHVTIKVGLKLLSAWGKCMYFDHTQDMAGTVVLDPAFFANRVLFKLFSGDSLRLLSDPNSPSTKGELSHEHLAEIWPALHAKKGFKEVAKSVLDYLSALLLSYPAPTSSKDPDFLEGKSIFPFYLPGQAPRQLRHAKEDHNHEDEFSDNWWPAQVPKGFVELCRVYNFTRLTPEFVSRLLVHLQRARAAKALWKYGYYYEDWQIRALVQFEAEDPPESSPVQAATSAVALAAPAPADHGSGSDADMISMESLSTAHPSPLPLAEPLLRRLLVRVRADKGTRGTALLSSIASHIEDVLQIFAGTSFELLVPSPFDPKSFIRVADLEQAHRGSEAGGQVKVHCPSTKQEVDSGALLAQAGLMDDPHQEVNFWWTWFPDERWVGLEKEGASYSKYLFLEDGRIKDPACYEKLRQAIGNAEELKTITYAYAIHNPKLKGAFEDYQESVKKKQTPTSASETRAAWKRRPEAVKREALLKRLEQLVLAPTAMWNERGRPSALSVMSGGRDKDVWGVCSSGFGLLKDNHGCLGKGIYMTPSLSLALQKSEVVDGRGRAVVVGLATLGNTFPVVEHPFGSSQSYMEKNCEPGFQSHFSAVNRLSGYPIQKEFNDHSDADQIVLFNHNQLLPLFVIYCQ